MKLKKSSPYFFISALFMLGISSLTSCLEGDDDSFRTTSSVLFVNVYNDAPQGVNIVVDDSKWNYGYRPYDTVHTYNAFYSSTHSFSAVPDNSSSAVANVSQDLKSDTSYTCFVTGKSGEGKMVFFVDTLVSARLGKVKIRFVNLSPDMSKIDFGIADSTRKFTNLDYLNAAYVTIDTGIHKYNVYGAGLNVPLKSVKFRAIPGGIYTMYTKGLIARKGVDSAAIRYFIQPVK